MTDPFPEEFEFLAWYFTFMDSDSMTCPHCGATIERDELFGAFNKDKNNVICPDCGNSIGQDDLI